MILLKERPVHKNGRLFVAGASAPSNPTSPSQELWLFVEEIGSGAEHQGPTAREFEREREGEWNYPTPLNHQDVSRTPPSFVRVRVTTKGQRRPTG
jgi:hypothetical protein